MIDRLMRFTSHILLAAAALALAAMMAILTWQVFARYVLGASPPWAEQTSLVLMIWMTFLGTAAGIGESFHIRIVEGLMAIPEKWRANVVRLANLLVLCAGILIAWLGSALVAATWTNAVPTLPLTRGMVYLVIPFAGLLIGLFALEKLLCGEKDVESVSAA